MNLRLAKPKHIVLDGIFDIFYNEVFVGQFYQEVDGYYVYDSSRRGGFVNAVFLRALADKLDEINKPWHDEVMKTLNKDDVAKVVGQDQKSECERKDGWDPVTFSQIAKRHLEITQRLEQAQKECNCHACFNKNPTTLFRPFIVCPVCGNKRCPKASDHNNTCTGSNEPGQAGSLY